MRRYIASRLGTTAVLVGTITVGNFILTHVIPGSPLDALVGDYPVPPTYLEQARTEFGLDKPLVVQLWLYLGSLIRGNLGFSFANQQPVLPLILHRAEITLLLMVPSLAAASVFGILLGGLAARRPGSLLDTGISVLTLSGYSTPVFWLAQILILVFAIWLRVLPAQGILSVGDSQVSGLAVVPDYLQHLILPGLAVTVSYMAVVTRVARASIAEARKQDFVLLARAKGLGYNRVFWRHVVPNGLLPIVTIIGYSLGYVLTGAILTETVFGWPGIGYLFITSVAQRDYPVMDGIFLLASVTVVIANLLTDLTYTVIDPRVANSYVKAT